MHRTVPWSLTSSEHQLRCVKWILIDANTFIAWPNPMFDHLLESSRWDDSNKWSNIGFGQEIDALEMKICTLCGALIIDIPYSCMIIKVCPVINSSVSLPCCEKARDYLQRFTDFLTLNASVLRKSCLHHLDKCQCIISLKSINSLLSELTILQNIVFKDNFDDRFNVQADDKK